MKVINTRNSTDNAVKYLIGLDDRNSVEALYMYDKDHSLTYHSTVCVSSQVGCAIGCKFCATGEQGFIRNLTPEEIYGQAALCDQSRMRAGYIPLDAVVFAGMGEPLLNYNNMLSAIEKIGSSLGLRHFELATVGIVPRMLELAGYVMKNDIRMRLNLSLHAATDEKRCALIPYTEKYGISEILAAAETFAEVTGTTARIRYMLIKGINDSDADMNNLITLLKGKRFKLIISQYNDNNITGLRPVNSLDVLNFYNKIKGAVDCDIFRNFGSAVLGGCGQLRRQQEVS